MAVLRRRDLADRGLSELSCFIAAARICPETFLASDAAAIKLFGCADVMCVRLNQASTE